MSIFFNELLESVKQMDEVVKGLRVLSREHNIDAIQGNETRKATDLGMGTVIDADAAARCVAKNFFDAHITGQMLKKLPA